MNKKKHILILFFILISGAMTAQEREYSVDKYTAPKILSGLSQQLNTFCKEARKEYIISKSEKPKPLYGPNRDYVLAFFTKPVQYKNPYQYNLDSIGPQIKYDLARLNGTRFDEKSTVRISQYLDELSLIAAKDTIVYEIQFCDYSTNNEGEPVIVKALWTVRSHKNSYTCEARLTFVYDDKGKPKIELVTMTGFKDTDNIKQQPKLSIHHTMLNFSAGVKFTPSANGANLGFGIDGLSKNWFLNRMRFGVEYNALLPQDGYTHYPTASGSMPSTMTYAAKKNGDFGLGINLGYMFSPGKYERYDIRYDNGLSFFIGIGGVFYDFWYEKTGPLKSDYTNHFSSALYIKPSLRWDIKSSIGLEIGYYICQQYNPIRGFSFQMTLNLPL